MEIHCENNLNEIKDLLLKIDNESYSKKLTQLSGASVGQHVRHILEFYLCLFEGIKEKKVNYENRKRDSAIENDIEVAINTIERIKSFLNSSFQDTHIYFEKHFSLSENKSTIIASSVFRELAFCLEHSIHHQTIIKVGLRELELEKLIDDNFGIDPATLRHNKKCVQ